MLDTQTFEMITNGSLGQTFQGPFWPFDAFTSNAISGMTATSCPPIPDAMLASGLALYSVETNTALVANTNAAPIRSWLRHGADNRGVQLAAPFPITVGANTYYQHRHPLQRPPGLRLCDLSPPADGRFAFRNFLSRSHDCASLGTIRAAAVRRQRGMDANRWHQFFCHLLGKVPTGR